MRGQAAEPPMKHPIRTFLVDDHPVVIAGARAMIEASDDIICVGEAYTGADALAKIEETAPDVVVLEVRLPDMDGLDLAEQLIERGFRGHIVVMTLYENRSYVERALQVGAKGFVQKRSACMNLLLAIRTAVLGGLFFDPPTASEMLTPPKPETADRSSADGSGLTTREQEVLRLIALGYGNKEIAYRMTVSVKSVETYKLRATQKLNLHSRAQIVHFAVTQGWMQASNAEGEDLTCRPRTGLTNSDPQEETNISLKTLTAVGIASTLLAQRRLPRPSRQRHSLRRRRKTRTCLRLPATPGRARTLCAR